MEQQHASKRRKLSRIFSTHRTPRRVENDNGSRFKSELFADFAEEQGSNTTELHQNILDLTVKKFHILNKTETIADMQNKDSTIAAQEMLMGYRSTPHPATEVSPYESLMKRQVQ